MHNAKKIQSFIPYLILGVVLFLVYKFWNVITSFFSGGLSAKEQAKNEITLSDSVNKIEVNKSKLTKSSAAYASVAASLYTSMNNASFFEPFAKVQNILKDMNSEELKHIYKIFGLRINDTFNVGGLINQKKWDLGAWFSYEFSGTNLAWLQGRFKITGLVF